MRLRSHCAMDGGIDMNEKNRMQDDEQALESATDFAAETEAGGWAMQWDASALREIHHQRMNTHSAQNEATATDHAHS